MTNYLVVLFKNKKKKKIINKFITFDKANSFFERQIKESEEIIFEKEVNFSEESDYELGLVQLGKSPETKTYLKDDFGRNIVVKIDEENMTLIKISPIKIQELIYDCQQKKKITLEQFEKKYLKKDGVKLLSGLNNRVVLQKDEEVYIFTFKNEKESSRFLDCLSNHYFRIKRMDTIIVKDTSKPQKKYLYSLLESKGFDKQFLYRKFTWFPRAK